MAAAGLSAALFIYGLWAVPGDAFFQLTASILVLAVAAALISLLSAWPGTGRMAWVRTAASILAVIGGAMIVTAIWNGDDLPGVYWRLFGVVMVLLAAAAIATPVVNRMSSQTAPEPYTHCPFDGATVSGVVGKRTVCPGCGRKYEVALR
jgi:predicted membrane channel-forming protein YqfA (hemolysin III family)